MKLSLFALGALTVTALIGTPAAAQNYPWCAYYSDDFGGTCRPVRIRCSGSASSAAATARRPDPGRFELVDPRFLPRYFAHL